MRAGRRLFDVIGACVLGGVVFVAIAGPASPSPAPRATDTFTTVDVRVDDHGVSVDTATVPAGIIQFTLTDARHAKSSDLSARVIPGPITVTAPNTRATLRSLGIYTVSAPGSASTATFTVVAPVLRAPHEAAHDVHVVIGKHGITTPHREMRREEPASDAPDARVWTRVVPGATRFLFTNRTGEPQQCALSGVASTGATVRDTARLSVTLGGAASGSNIVVLKCTGATTGAQQFDFLIGG